MTLVEFSDRILLAQRYSSIYYSHKGAMNISSTTFRYCYGNYGAIYKIINASIYDFNSTYIGNAGYYGGVVYCKNCYMYFKQSTFVNNFAAYGGTFYIDGNGMLELEDVTVTSSTATIQGGLVYGKGSSDVQTSPLWGKVEISINTTGIVAVTLTNSKSFQDGGMIYLQNGTLTITDSAISQGIALGKGGLLYTSGEVSVTIKSCQLTNYQAGYGGLVYSTGASTDPAALIQFTGPTLFQTINSTYHGGVFYIDNPKMTLNLQTAVTLNNT